jgi:predicted ATPase/DNA-binding winged helix-turn-helix (wHTH) protein
MGRWSANDIVSFGPFRLYPARRLLERNGVPVGLSSRALDILIALVTRPGEVISKKELELTVWAGLTVEDSGLRVHVAGLRKVLCDGRDGIRYVANVPSRGYCFVAPVTYGQISKADRREPGLHASFHNLPTRISTVIGRTSAIGEISRRLLEQRIVTVVGMGGIGKTTVAVAAAQEVAPHFGNVFYVDLAPLGDGRLVPSTLASVLGLIIQSNDPMPALVNFLRGKNGLVVFDNCEHVIETVASLIEGIIQGVTGVHILATSREPLRTRGESVIRLPSLDCPLASPNLTSAEAMAFPAVQLFVERAHESSNSFNFEDAIAPAIAEICNRLDGIPLAIELAAGRVEAFGVSGLCEGLNDVFALLIGGHRGALPRHQTLHATLEWSYRLLSSTEQATLRRISIFRASFTLPSAVTVAAFSGLSPRDVTDGVASLVMKSLVAADAAHAGTRYRLPQTTRAYANEILATNDEAAPLTERHARHCLDLLERAEWEWGLTPKQKWMAAYASRIDDIRAALDWAFSPDGDLLVGVSLAASSAPTWFALSLVDEYCTRLERAVHRMRGTDLEDSELEMKLTMWLIATITNIRGYGSDLVAAAKRVLHIASVHNAPHYQLGALRELVRERLLKGDYHGCFAHSKRFAEVATAAGNQSALSTVDLLLGLTLHLVGYQRQALERLRRALDANISGIRVAPNIFHEYDDEGALLGRMARVLWLRGFPDQAMRLVDDAVQRSLNLGHPPAVYHTLGFAACPVAFWVGDIAAMKRYVSLSRQNLSEISSRYSESWHLCCEFALSLRENGCAPQFRRERQAVLKAAIGSFALDHFVTLHEEVVDAASSARAQRGEAGWCAAELIRAKGSQILKSQGRKAASEAKALFRQAIRISRHDGALSWELRAAISLARLSAGERHYDEAYETLAPVYARFTEGFATRDLMIADGLLQEFDRLRAKAS